MESLSQKTSRSEHIELWETENRSGFIITVDDQPGQLSKVLSTMSKYNINLTSIHSKPPHIYSGRRTMNFHIDFTGCFNDENVKKCAKEIKDTAAIALTELGTDVVPWFPTKIQDFDFIGKRILGEGDGI